MPVLLPFWGALWRAVTVSSMALVAAAASRAGSTGLQLYRTRKLSRD